MIYITGDTHSSFTRFSRKRFPDQDDMTKDDYVITHCAPTGFQARLGRDDADVLTDYLESIRQRLDYKKWFFGHYHANLEIDDRHVLLYEHITRLL